MRPLRGTPKALLLTLFLAALAAAGCTSHGYVVRADRAPLYGSEDRKMVIGRMERLAAGEVLDRAEEGDPVEVRYRGDKGYADRAHLRIFELPRDERRRAHVFFANRREVVLEGKDWPAATERAIREDRIDRGMTREMVELAWGYPDEKRPLEGGGEEWVYESWRYEMVEGFDYYAGPYPYAYYDPFFPYHGHAHFHYGYGPHFGPSFGFAYTFPLYEPRRYRTYYARAERRRVSFGADGKVSSWSTTAP